MPSGERKRIEPMAARMCLFHAAASDAMRRAASAAVSLFIVAATLA